MLWCILYFSGTTPNQNYKSMADFNSFHSILITLSIDQLLHCCFFIHLHCTCIFNLITVEHFTIIWTSALISSICTWDLIFKLVFMAELERTGVASATVSCSVSTAQSVNMSRSVNVFMVAVCLDLIRILIEITAMSKTSAHSSVMEFPHCSH